MRPAALGGTPPRNPFEEAWVPVPVHMVPGSTSTVAADLSQVNYRRQLRLFLDHFSRFLDHFSRFFNNTRVHCTAPHAPWDTQYSNVVPMPIGCWSVPVF